MEFLRLIKVTGMASSRQHGNSGFGYLLKILQRLKAQGTIKLSINNQSWNLEIKKNINTLRMFPRGFYKRSCRQLFESPTEYI